MYKHCGISLERQDAAIRQKRAVHSCAIEIDAACYLGHGFRRDSSKHATVIG